MFGARQVKGRGSITIGRSAARDGLYDTMTATGKAAFELAFFKTIFSASFEVVSLSMQNFLHNCRNAEFEDGFKLLIASVSTLFELTQRLQKR